MAIYEDMGVITLEAGGDMSSDQYAFVDISADGQIDKAGDGAFAVGVLQNDPAAAGRAAKVANSGLVKVKCGGTVTAGGPVSSDANGLAVDSASGDVILGEATEGGAANQVITILFAPRGTI